MISPTYCPSCGYAVSSQDQTCPKCGADVQRAAPTPVWPPAPTAALSPNPDPNVLSREDLVQIASAQKLAIATVGVELLFVPVIASFFTHVSGIVVSIVEITLGIFQIVSIYRLCKALKTFSPLIITIFSLIPLVGFFILLFTSSLATKKLRSAGIPVGLFGANTSDM